MSASSRKWEKYPKESFCKVGNVRVLLDRKGVGRETMGVVQGGMELDGDRGEEVSMGHVVRGR